MIYHPKRMSNFTLFSLRIKTYESSQQIINGFSNDLMNKKKSLESLSKYFPSARIWQKFGRPIISFKEPCHFTSFTVRC